MKTALWLLAAVLPLAAQPKKLVNAQLDTRSAAGGLEAAFRAARAARPQPAWIGYTVPAARTRQFGCDGYWRDGETAIAGGTVHLEPPMELLILFRVEGDRVERIRTLAPDCEIDAGGVPVHWLADVNPAQSVALLATFVTGSDHPGHGALGAIALHADATADATLEGYVAPDKPDELRRRAVFWLGAARGRRGYEAVRRIIESDSSERVRERAVHALSVSRQPEVFDMLTALARNDRSPRVRRSAMTWLGQSHDPRAIAFFEDVLKAK